jgi:hypothetical protein
MNTSNVQKPEACSYILHDNGIHEFILMEATRRGVDQLVELINQLYDKTTPDETVYEIIEFRGGMPPISYAVQRAREQLARYPKMPKLRAVILYDTDLFISFIIPLANVIFSRVNNLNVKYYPKSNREAAIAWLLQGK